MEKRRLAAIALAAMVSMATGAFAQTVPLPQPAPAQRGGAPTPPAAVPGKPVPPMAINPGGKSFSAIAKPGGTIAFEPNQRALVDRVSTYLSSVQTLAGDFVQVGPDGSRSEGKFYLQKPGKVRFEYNPPSPVELIADGTSVAIRDRKLATQDLLLLSQTPLRFLLAQRIDLMKDTSLVGVSADDSFVTVTIEEKQTFGGSHRLMLMLDAKDLALKQWTVTDPQGYDTTVAIFNTDSPKKMDPGLFRINYDRVIQ